MITHPGRQKKPSYFTGATVDKYSDRNSHWQILNMNPWFEYVYHVLNESTR
jgi:hypothetical protein